MLIAITNYDNIIRVSPVIPPDRPQIIQNSPIKTPHIDIRQNCTDRQTLGDSEIRFVFMYHAIFTNIRNEIFVTECKSILITKEFHARQSSLRNFRLLLA